MRPRIKMNNVYNKAKGLLYDKNPMLHDNSINYYAV